MVMVNGGYRKDATCLFLNCSSSKIGKWEREVFKECGHFITRLYTTTIFSPLSSK
jgi:hypothetical protein